jgi:hypothetical protein
MSVSVGHAALEAHAAMSAVIALCGELLQKGALDVRSVEVVKDVMLRSVRSLPVDGHPPKEVAKAIEQGFAWSTGGQVPEGSKL